MQQSSATQSLYMYKSCFLGVVEDCCMLSLLSQCLLVSTVFGIVSSLHPTSFLYLYIHLKSQVNMIHAKNCRHRKAPQSI